MWLGSGDPPNFGGGFAGQPLARVSEFEPIIVTGSADDPLSRRNLRAGCRTNAPTKFSGTQPGDYRMRPGQQNKRGRGRSGNNNNGGGNRKGQNPLSRTYDSSGPDVKVRGTAQHVAEKYMNLARDAQSSGDRVMAENYLQHAEHYNRIIMTAQAQMQERFQRDDNSAAVPRFSSRIRMMMIAIRDDERHQWRPGGSVQRARRANPSHVRPERQERGNRRDRSDRRNGKRKPRDQERTGTASRSMIPMHRSP
jgi:hypothetical protein